MGAWRWGIGLLAAIGLNGCSNNFEGYNDVGRVSEQRINPQQGAERRHGFAVKYEPNSAVEPPPFAPDDEIAIFLKRAFVAYFPDLGVAARTSSFAWLPEFARKTGEIAIVGNATLLSADEETGVGSRDIASKGRVIFFSDDVYQGQLLNFSFLPFAGPIKWDGSPLRIDLTVIEIDSKGNAPFNAVLSKLSTLGGSFGLSGQGVSVLSSIGTALVEGNKDDLIGAYTFYLTAPSQNENVFVPVMRPGDYVIIRKDLRAEMIDWSSIFYDPSMGLLYTCEHAMIDGGCPAGAAVPLKSHNYYVLTIQKAQGTNRNKTMTLQQLNAQINDADTSEETLGKVVEDVAAVLSAGDAKVSLEQAIHALRYTTGGVEARRYKMMSALPYLICSGYVYTHAKAGDYGWCNDYLKSNKPAYSEKQVRDYLDQLTALAEAKGLSVPALPSDLSTIQDGIESWADALSQEPPASGQEQAAGASG